MYGEVECKTAESRTNAAQLQVSLNDAQNISTTYGWPFSGFLEMMVCLLQEILRASFFFIVSLSTSCAKMKTPLSEQDLTEKCSEWNRYCAETWDKTILQQSTDFGGMFLSVYWFPSPVTLHIRRWSCVGDPDVTLAFRSCSVSAIDINNLSTAFVPCAFKQIEIEMLILSNGFI